MKKVLIILGVFLVVFLAYFVKKGADFYKGIYKQKPGIAGILPAEKNQYNILLLGYGGPGHDGPYLTDSIMIAHIDTKANKIALISLPRDIFVKVPTKSGADFHMKVNAVYQTGLFPKDYPDVNTTKYPDVSLVKHVVQNVTGLPIDNYATIDFAGFEKAIDIMGGVDVKVLKTFDDYGYPIEGKEDDLCGRDADFAQIDKYMKPGFDENEKTQFFKDHPDLETFYNDIQADPPVKAFPCRYEHLHFDAGIVHMDGKTALKYVRSRHSIQDGTDFGRAARQQEFVRSVKEQVISLNMITKIGPLLDELKNHIKMDISVDEMKKFMAEAVDASKYRLINIRMSNEDYLKDSYDQNYGYILAPRAGIDNWTLVHNMIRNSIDEITPTPTPAPTAKVTPSAKLTPSTKK